MDVVLPKLERQLPVRWAHVMRLPEDSRNSNHSLYICDKLKNFNYFKTHKMEKLLQWSIAHQSGDKEAIEKVGAPDPRMLEQLFGGADEPTLMKQAMMVVGNKDATDEDKLTALDNFEMLIENLDNANNIENLGLWQGIIDVLTSESNVDLQVQAASIIGVATQNNPKSQQDFNKYPHGLERLISLCTNQSTSQPLLLKCLFAIACFVRNFEPGYQSFTKNNGWDILKLKSPSDDKLNMRILSLTSALFSTGLDDEKVSLIQKYDVLDFVSSILTKDGHTGCIDKCLNIVNQLHQLNFQFNQAELLQLQQGLHNVEHLQEHLHPEDLAASKAIAGCK